MSTTKSLRHLVSIGILLLVAAACLPPSEEKTLTLWHAWEGSQLEALSALVADYQREGGVQVEMVAHDSHAALVDALLAAGDGPDLFIGSQSAAARLAERGRVAAYCLPGQCPECEQPNPPRWCQYATGKDFSDGFNADFLVSTALCESDQCPVCFTDNPPPWCRFATQDRGVAVDLFQAGFLKITDDGVFPFGIPIWWDYVAVFANPQWFVEQQQQIPSTMAGVLELVEQVPGSFYLDARAEPDPVPWAPGLGVNPEPQPWRDLLAAGDPSPQPSVVGIVVTWGRDFGRLQGQIADLALLPLPELLPQPAVEGVFVTPYSAERSAALDLAYAVADEDSQEKLFAAAGGLPASGEAWSRISDAVWERFKRDSLISFLRPGLELELPDPRDFVAVPPLEPPPIRHLVCGPAAQRNFANEAAGGVAAAVRAHLGFQSWEDWCALLLARHRPADGAAFANCLVDNAGRPSLVAICCDQVGCAHPP